MRNLRNLLNQIRNYLYEGDDPNPLTLPEAGWERLNDFPEIKKLIDEAEEHLDAFSEKLQEIEEKLEKILSSPASHKHVK